MIELSLPLPELCAAAIFVFLGLYVYQKRYFWFEIKHETANMAA